MWQRTVGVEGVISCVFNHPFSLSSALFIFLRQSSHQSIFDSLCFVRSFPTEEIFFVMLGFVEFVSEFSSCRKCVCVSSRIYFLSLFSLICFYCSLRTTPRLRWARHKDVRRELAIFFYYFIFLTVMWSIFEWQDFLCSFIPYEKFANRNFFVFLQILLAF